MSESEKSKNTPIEPLKTQYLHGNIMSVSAVFENVWISARAKNHYLADKSAFEVWKTRTSFSSSFLSIHLSCIFTFDLCFLQRQYYLSPCFPPSFILASPIIFPVPYTTIPPDIVGKTNITPCHQKILQQHKILS